MPLSAAFARDDGSPNEPGVHSPWDRWIGASRTYNFCCEDPLLDWLHRYGAASGFSPDTAAATYNAETDFTQFIFEQGRAFEDRVCAHLATTRQLTRICADHRDIRTRQAAESTWVAMSRGDEIIAQGALWNPQTETYGAPDLLVRSDVLHALFPKDFPAASASVGAPDLGANPWHYVVVDVKYTTLALDKHGHAKSNHVKYMVQLFVYNEALGRLQGLTPPAAFLLGRRWEQLKMRGTSALERLARIDMDHDLGDMSLAAYAQAGCDWIRRVNRDGAGWQVLPTPSAPELWPNMRHSEDQPWHSAKRQIADALEDVTILPRVTPEKRAIAAAAGILRWTDAQCCASAFGITTPAYQPQVDAVITANHSPTGGPIVFPAMVTANEGLWRTPLAPEFYVDFETVSNLDDDLSTFPEAGGQPLIFMIGCGHLEDPADLDSWRFEIFVTNRVNEPEEARIIDEWIAHMQSVSNATGRPLAEGRIFHWSPAETSTFSSAYNSARERQPDRNWPDLPWIDLLAKVVKAQPVTVRGAFGFGLKAIAKAMHRHGLIQTNWADGPTDGLGAMVGAWRCEQRAAAANTSMANDALMQEIKAYNEVDCRVMAEVLRFLRANR